MILARQQYFYTEVSCLQLCPFHKVTLFCFVLYVQMPFKLLALCAGYLLCRMEMHVFCQQEMIHLPCVK